MDTPPIPEKALCQENDLKGIFLEVLTGIVPELNQALNTADWQQVSHLAHRLEGSAAMFGYCKVSAAGAAFQAVWALAKAPRRVKTDPELAESAKELVGACERALRPRV